MAPPLFLWGKKRGVGLIAQPLKIFESSEEFLSFVSCFYLGYMIILIASPTDFFQRFIYLIQKK